MKLSPRLEEYRLRSPASPHRATWGAFDMPGPCGERLVIIASDAVDEASEGWEHVSVSTRRRIPNWIEMSFVKSLFWPDDEWVVQFHPPTSEHVNNHPHCLHLWRSTRHPQPTPPSILVGIKDAGELTSTKQAREVARAHGIDWL